MNILLKLFFKTIFSLSSLELQDPNTSFLTLIIYETPEYKCESCELVKKILNKKNIKYKMVNFIENLNISSRFIEITFPSIFYKNKLDFYKVPIEMIEDLTNDNLYNICINKDYKIRKIFSPNSFLSKTMAFIFSNGFPLYLYIKGYLDLIPFYVIISFFIVFLIYIYYSTNINEEKINEDEDNINEKSKLD